MRRIHADSYVRMPWKNGGGTTTEILKAPAEGRFDYRISVADVASDGPFSRFDGYDRHIMVLEGAGMTLDCGAHGTLSLAPLTPVFFSGDWDVTGTLTSGPVRDFNVIVDRTKWRAEVEVTTESTLLRADACIFHIFGNDTLVGEGELRTPAATGASVRLFRS
jgi:environmental stress-induced protein Ves